MNCNHDFVTVGARRWCVRRYTHGGCGGFWSLRGGAWRLVPALSGLFSEAL